MIGFLDILGATLTLGCVWTAKMKSVTTWPIGVFGAIVYGILFYKTQLYADSILQIVYVGMGVAGFLAWNNNEQDKIATKKLSLSVFLSHLLYVNIGCLVIGFLLMTYTDSRFPIMDATITSLSLLANYYLIKGYLQTWLLWMIVDFLLVILMAINGLYFSMGLYCILFAICVMSYFEWRNDFRYDFEQKI